MTGVRTPPQGKTVIIDGQVLQSGPGRYSMAEVREPLPFPSWGESWLEKYSNSRNIRFACLNCFDEQTGQKGISRTTYARYRDYCPDFAARLPEAANAAVERLEAAAWDIALNDRNPLMIRWLLERLKPELYNLKRQDEALPLMARAETDEIEEARQQILGILLPSGESE
jgi:hypothetical protein